jgi:hypothetical protein
MGKLGSISETQKLNDRAEKCSSESSSEDLNMMFNDNSYHKLSNFSKRSNKTPNHRMTCTMKSIDI